MKEGRAEKRKPRKLFQRGDIRGRRKFERVSIKPRTVALKKMGGERKRERKKKKERKEERKGLALLDKGKIKIRGQEEKPI